MRNREHGNTVIGEVTLDQAYGGARGIKSLVWEVGSTPMFRAFQGQSFLTQFFVFI